MEETKTEVIQTEKPQEPVLIPNENCANISDYNRTSNDKNNDYNNGKSLKENIVENNDEKKNKDFICSSNAELCDDTKSHVNNINTNTETFEKTEETSLETLNIQQNPKNEDINDNKNINRNENVINQNIDKGETNSNESNLFINIGNKNEKIENLNGKMKGLKECNSEKEDKEMIVNNNFKKKSMNGKANNQISSKESLSENKDDNTSESESDESCDQEEEENDNGNNSIEFEENNPQGSAIDYKNLKGIEPKNKKKAINPYNFYEKKITEKREKEKKLENLRKKMDTEVKKTMTKPLINPESKKIMEKKQGIVKPIYERAKEIEDTKKTKIETIKKTVTDKKIKEEDEVMKSKILNSSKMYDEKEFSRWQSQNTEWQNKKIQKIENEKERKIKLQEEEISKYYQPNIHKSEFSKSKMETNIYDKLYNLKDEKKEKLMQKIIESIPEFKPSINKKLPKFIQNKKENPLPKLNNINSIIQNNISKTPRKSTDLPYNNLICNEKAICNTDRLKRNHALSMNYYTANNVIYSENEESEDEQSQCKGEQDEIINQYKQALEKTNKINIKNTLRISEKK